MKLSRKNGPIHLKKQVLADTVAFRVGVDDALSPLCFCWLYEEKGRGFRRGFVGRCVNKRWRKTLETTGGEGMGNWEFAD